MLKNYWITAIRNLMRSKGFTALNLTGLAVGMASATLILLWIHNESTYEGFNVKKDRIYEVWNRAVISGKLACWRTTPQILAPTLRQEYPAIAGYCRVDSRWFVTDAGGDHRMSSHAFVVDSSFLTMFTLPMVAGSPASALQDPHSIVLTQSFARRLFGGKDPMNATVKIDQFSFRVTGVLKDLPANTEMDFEYLLPFAFERMRGDDDTGKPYAWGNNGVNTWVLLQPGATEAEVDRQIVKTTMDHSKGEEKTDIFLHPLSKVHLWSEFDNGVNTGGYITTVRLFGLIAVFILLVACINFMNLSTARSERRAIVAQLASRLPIAQHLQVAEQSDALSGEPAREGGADPRQQPDRPRVPAAMPPRFGDADGRLHVADEAGQHDGGRRAVQRLRAREVERRLVDRQRLQQRRQLRHHPAGHNHAAPRTPDESPCLLRTIGVCTKSLNT